MTAGDIIFSLISLALVILFIFNPLIRKIAVSTKMNMKNKAIPGSKPPLADSSERPFNMSADSQRVLQRTVHGYESTLPSWNRPPLPVSGKALPLVESKTESTDRLSVLRKAILWREILSPPLALRDYREDRF
jgi:hypothetical protein